jgi:hypothetical protein
MALTIEQRNEIVELRLQGATVRQTAQQTGHAVNTITKAWRSYMAEHAAVRKEEVEARREELVQRAEHVAQQARSEAGKYRRIEKTAVENGERVIKVEREGNAGAYQRLLTVELQALREIARLTGADLPVQVEVSGTLDVNVAVSDQRRLADYAADLCRSLN